MRTPMEKWLGFVEDPNEKGMVQLLLEILGGGPPPTRNIVGVTETSAGRTLFLGLSDVSLK